MLRAFWSLPINKKTSLSKPCGRAHMPYTQCFERPCECKDACAPTTDRKRSLRDATRAHGECMRTYGRSVSLPLLVPGNENNVGAHPILMRAIAGREAFRRPFAKKHVRPFHTYVSARADTYIIMHAHTKRIRVYRIRLSGPHAFIVPATQKRAHEGRMRTYGSTCDITFVGAHPLLMRACFEKKREGGGDARIRLAK